MSVGGTGQPAESTEGAPRKPEAYDTRIQAIAEALSRDKEPRLRRGEYIPDYYAVFEDARAALAALAAELADLRQALERIVAAHEAEVADRYQTIGQWRERAGNDWVQASVAARVSLDACVDAARVALAGSVAEK